MKVSMSPRFQAAVCVSRTARIWDSSEGSAGDAVEEREARARQIVADMAASKAMRDFADILCASSVGCRCVCFVVHETVRRWHAIRYGESKAGAALRTGTAGSQDESRCGADPSNRHCRFSG